MSRVLFITKVAAAMVAGSLASLAHAEPFALTAGCKLTSMVAGQGKCVLSATFTDFGSSTIVKRAQIKVNGVVAGQSNNDSLNPYTFMMEGETGVTCGASYTVTGHIMRSGSTTYEQTGSVPAVACPKAP
jgi:hypothetical protein